MLESLSADCQLPVPLCDGPGGPSTVELAVQKGVLLNDDDARVVAFQPRDDREPWLERWWRHCKASCFRRTTIGRRNRNSGVPTDRADIDVERGARRA